MSNELALKRQPMEHKNEVLFFIEDSNGKQITIKQTVRAIKGQQVKISFQAPNNVKIFRGELM